MKEFFKKLKIHSRRISVRFALICFAIIIPANLLAVGFCVLLYHNYQEKIIADYQVQLSGFVNSFDQELEREEEAMAYLFATDSFAPFAFEDFSDPAVASVALKNVLNQLAFADFAPGIRYIWNKNSDLLSFFHNDRYYSLDVQRMLEEQIRSLDSNERFDKTQEILSVDGCVFVGSRYTIQNYSIGIYLDVEKKLADLFSFGMEPKGSLLLMDGSGKSLCAYGAQGFTQERELPSARDAAVWVEQDLQYSDLSLVQIVERGDQGELMNLVPVILFAVIGLALLTFLMLPIIYATSNRVMLRPVSKMLYAMERVGEGDLTIRLPETASTADIEFMNRRFNQMVTEIQDLRIKGYEQEIDRLKTEAINLKLQVNPHMFLNSMNVIYSLGRTGKTEQICDFAVQLMNYFRYSLRSDAEFATLLEELAFVSSYLSIQTVRFPGRFVCTSTIDKKAENVRLPRLLIETFVENIMKYAIRSDGITEISISAAVVHEKLRVVISDTGNGMDEHVLRQINSRQIVEDIAGRHTGIWNSRRRLDFYYKDNYSLTIHSEIGKGTQVEIIVPVSPDSGEPTADGTKKLRS